MTLSHATKQSCLFDSMKRFKLWYNFRLLLLPSALPRLGDSFYFHYVLKAAVPFITLLALEEQLSADHSQFFKSRAAVFSTELLNIIIRNLWKLIRNLWHPTKRLRIRTSKELPAG